MHVPGASEDILIRCLRFEELDIHTLYELLKLRQEVFCVEQECAYLDLDGKDQLAWHMLIYKAGGLVATSRILMPGESYPDASSIGRVLTADSVRGLGLGRMLMHHSIEQCQLRFPEHPIRISAQKHLLELYRSFGFEPQGDEYLEDGIPHVAMVRSQSAYE
jgi:ElaA protein